MPVRQVERALGGPVEHAGVGDLDGNEFGGSEATLYACGPDADALFSIMAPALRGLCFRPAHVILRYGEGSDPSAREVRWGRHFP